MRIQLGAKISHRVTTNIPKLQNYVKAQDGQKHDHIKGIKKQ